MTITLELPPDLEAILLAEARAQGRDAADLAVERLAASFATSPANGAPALRPFSEYPTEDAFIKAAAEAARRQGFDPDLCAALAEGIADGERGRTVSLEEARAEWQAARR